VSCILAGVGTQSLSASSYY